MENTSINLKPLAEMMELNGFSAAEYAGFLDELAFDYAQTMIELQLVDQTPKSCLHENSAIFLYRLKELRDTFRKCSNSDSSPE
jgi:hypothetical protein